ncbi:MAG: chlorite dismutase family protein [Thermoplasmata archaeon]|nr:chlorite dismutase family protein [Candidatus Sysuiplasma acidicola]MBX8637787.1 chlorite dismutase family protein [Candidatus Sysuiplasma acidicola]MBX8646651.1 chlorite dismutase family protein [Candidatus Sysuiplasma acidicola]MDH2905914.1 chlorite dismutase family protein [Methanomassiliicoccales archaeon]
MTDVEGNELHNFTFYKLDAAATKNSGEQKDAMKTEFMNVLEGTGVEHAAYTLLGLRAETDFMIHFRSSDAELLQNEVAKLRKTAIAAYLTTPYVYLCTKRKSEYKAEGESEVHLASGEGKFLFVYPFVKTREWYLLSSGERRRIMAEHIMVGRKYPGVRINTAYSFGIGDQDFLLSFDSDDLFSFQTLVMDLRNTEASRYTVRDTPMFVCLKKTMSETLDQML